MTDKQTPPDWVLIEAAKRAGLKRSPAQLRAGQIARSAKPYFRALCDMIELHEEPPVDRRVLCAREACLEQCSWVYPDETRQGAFDHHPHIGLCLRAIELYEEGFGK